MPQSTGRDLHIDRLLSQIAISYANDVLIAGTIAPMVTVEKQGDLYTVFDRADAFRIEDAKRSPATEANKITRSISSDSYFCQNYALKYPVTLEDRENADPVFRQNLINDAGAYLVDKHGLDWENRVATLVLNTSNVGSSSGVGSEWDAAASSDPLGDLNTALDAAEDLTGTRPNKAIFGKDAWRTCRRNDQILNRLFGSNNGGGFAQRQQVASLLEIEEIMVGGAYKNTGNEAQAESLSKIWGDDVLLYYVPPTPRRDTPSFMYSFRWQPPGMPHMQAERHPFDPKTKSEEVEVGYYQIEKIVGSQYGYLLKAVNSST